MGEHCHNGPTFTLTTGTTVDPAGRLPCVSCAETPTRAKEKARVVQHSTHDNLPDASSRLYRWGVAACRHRLAILILPTLIALACLPLLATVEDRLSSGGWLPFGSEAAQVDRVLDEQFGRHATAHYLLFSDPNGSLLATETLFRREVERTVAPLRNDPSVLAIHTWGTTTNPALHPLLISDDERQSLAIVMVDQDVKTAAAEIPRLRELLTNDVLDVQIGGWPATTEDFRDLTSSDLRRAEPCSWSSSAGC